jgi:hypothetical protein
VDADGVAERRQEPSGEELDPLRLVKPAGARQEGLEPIGILLHGPRAAALGELKHRGGAKGRGEPQIQEILEITPRWRAVIVLQLGEPQLCGVIQMIGRHAHVLFRHGSVLAEVGLTLVEEQHRVGRAVEVGKIPLPVFRVELLLARPLRMAAIGATRRRRLGLLLHRGHVGLHGSHLSGHGLRLGEQIGEGGFGHGC